MHHSQVLPQLCKTGLGKKGVSLHKINCMWFFEMSVNWPIASAGDKSLGFMGLTFSSWLSGTLTMEVAKLENAVNR